MAQRVTKQVALENMYCRTAELCTTQCVVCTCMIDEMCRRHLQQLHDDFSSN